MFQVVSKGFLPVEAQRNRQIDQQQVCQVWAAIGKGRVLNGWFAVKSAKDVLRVVTFIKVAAPVCDRVIRDSTLWKRP